MPNYCHFLVRISNNCRLLRKNGSCLVISLTQLCEKLGNALRTVDGDPVARINLTGVHISELTDPTPYLEGGELLLTTGIPLAGEPDSLRDYVTRLASRGVLALGLGLGAGTDDVPAQLESACAGAGVTLLIVPASIPFMHISRTYWDLVGKTEQADLAASLTLQTSLTQAATRPEAVAAVVKVLSNALGGWAVYLPADGSAETYWPPEENRVLPQLREETARLGLAGTHSAATFPLDGMDVVEYSIIADRRTAGFLAVCAGRPLRKADRQLMLTGCMLLAVAAQREWQLTRANSVLGTTATTLALNGFVDAARLVAGDLIGSPLAERVRLLAIRGDNLEALTTSELADQVSAMLSGEPAMRLGDSIRRCRLRSMEDGVCFLILETRTDPDPAEESGNPVEAAVSRRRAQPVPFAAALSRPMPLSQLPGSADDLRRSCLLARVGQISTGPGLPDPRAVEWVARLTAYSRADLVATVKSYIRNQGQWEVAARELKLHRNSLRHRIGIAAKLLDADLDDPDVSANLWLELRRVGAGNR
ncbi:PucR family transcriptional regulator [Cryobacterium sp. TMT1-2-2]|nr:PucR family transcriptional regulator [Cryobacterium sp. TMT1-2-2]